MPILKQIGCFQIDERLDFPLKVMLERAMMSILKIEVSRKILYIVPFCVTETEFLANEHIL